MVLSYEPTAAKEFAKDEGVLLAAAGTATVRMAVKGRASHAGAAPDQGRNALIELSYQLLQTQDVAKGIARRAAQLDHRHRRPGAQPDPRIRRSRRRRAPDRPDAADKLLAALRAKVA